VRLAPAFPKHQKKRVPPLMEPSTARGAAVTMRLAPLQVLAVSERFVQMLMMKHVRSLVVFFKARIQLVN